MELALPLLRAMGYDVLMKREMRRNLIIVGVLSDDKGRILLTQRDDPKFADAHLKWDLPGGRHEVGEKLEDTVLREITEETGYTAAVEAMIPCHLEHIWHAEDFDLEVVILGFFCRLTGGEPHLNDPKIAAMRWVKPGQAERLDCLIGTPEFIAASQAAGFIGV